MQEQPQLDGSTFQAQFKALLAQAPAGTVKDYHFVRVPSDKAPWLDTGIDLEPGDRISTFTTGITALKGTPIRFPAALQLWCRIGAEGDLSRDACLEQLRGGDARTALCRQHVPRRVCQPHRRACRAGGGL